MHTIIYLTGDKSSNKETLVPLFRNPIELKQVEHTRSALLEQAVSNSPYCEVLVVTGRVKNETVNKLLQNFCINNRLNYYYYGLQSNRF